MPASKKPRKKHQHKVTEKGLESWAMFTIRGEGWSESMLNDFAQDFLFPLDAIYWSKGEDPLPAAEAMQAPDASAFQYHHRGLFAARGQHLPQPGVPEPLDFR